MVAKTQLAALDNNANTGRSQAVIKSDERAGEARYKFCFPKANKRWVVKPINEKKSYQFCQTYFQRCSVVLSRGMQPHSHFIHTYHVTLPQNKHLLNQMQYANIGQDLIDDLTIVSLWHVSWSFPICNSQSQ